MNDELVLVAITGGFATGKSTVAQYIENAGYPVINTDHLAKELMANDDSLKRSLLDAFGSETYLENGALNNAYISKIVFGTSKESAKQLDTLNQLVHPRVIDEMMSKIEEMAESGEKLIFVESALIYEAELDAGFDYVLVVTSKLENQIKRAVNIRKLTKEQALAIINSQISLDEKVKSADFSISNDSSMNDLINSISFLLPVIATLKAVDSDADND